MTWRSVFVLGALLLGAGAPTEAQTTADPVVRPYAPPVVLQALKATYPGVLSDVRLVGNDWEFQARGVAFSWAQGRLLPVAEAGRWSSFAPQPFYQYGADPPPVATWTAVEERQVEAQLAGRKATNVVRNGAFFDTLWRIHNRAEADARQKRLKLFGLPVTMHQDVAASLGRIEARLKAAAATNAELAAFLKGLKRLEGYNWRDIAGTQSRSNHAYGTAIDLIPRSYGGRAVYWLWAIQDESGWYKATWKTRWQPPAAVVRAFEDEGWVWGGKWILFDTIHFEYRPEILALNGLR